MNLRRALVFSKTLIALIASSLTYAALERFLDRGPSELPPETQHSLAQNLERDSVLRSAHHEQQSRLRATASTLHYDFNTDSAAGLVVDERLPAQTVPRAFLAGERALEVRAPGFGCEWASPELGAGSGFVLAAHCAGAALREPESSSRSVTPCCCAAPDPPDCA